MKKISWNQMEKLRRSGLMTDGIGWFGYENPWIGSLSGIKPTKSNVRHEIFKIYYSKEIQKSSSVWLKVYNFIFQNIFHILIPRPRFLHVSDIFLWTSSFESLESNKGRTKSWSVMCQKIHFVSQLGQNIISGRKKWFAKVDCQLSTLLRTLQLEKK